MANAALVLDNLALAAAVAASSRVLTMPASKLLTPHPSERWRSLSASDWFVLDSGGLITADTVMVGGLTCSAGCDAAAAAVLDRCDRRRRRHLRHRAGGRTATRASTSTIRRSSPCSKRRWPGAISASTSPIPALLTSRPGFVLEGLREEMVVNFAQGGSVQYVDRSRVSSTSSGLTLVWTDNHLPSPRPVVPLASRRPSATA